MKMTENRRADVRIALSAFRYSNDASAEAVFLQLIGLALAVSNEASTWFELRGRSGLVSLHQAGAAAQVADAVGGRTDLVFVTADAPAVIEAARAQGAETSLWDEAFGRQATVALSDHRVWINEEQSDLYGYRTHEASSSRVSVVVHCFVDDLENAEALYALFGWTRIGESGGAVRMECANIERQGAIFLHQSVEEVGFSVSFETEEGLPNVLDRLSAAGFDARMRNERIEATDPDGQLILIESAPH